MFYISQWKITCPLFVWDFHSVDAPNSQATNKPEVRHLLKSRLWVQMPYASGHREPCLRIICGCADKNDLTAGLSEGNVHGRKADNYNKKVSEKKKMQQHALHYEVCSFCQLRCDVLDIFAHVALFWRAFCTPTVVNVIGTQCRQVFAMHRLWMMWFYSNALPRLLKALPLSKRCTSCNP